jgi:hypothetical protein
MLMEVVSAEALESRLAGAERRIPESLSEFRGPSAGDVALPNRLAWSGLTEFDITDRRERLTLYRTLMDCGQRDDVVQYINAELLRKDWPALRRLMAYGLIAVWEQRLPALRAA